MIFLQTTKREFMQNAIGVFITLLTITLTVYLVQLLNRAAVGRIDAETVGPSLGFMTLNFMPTLLTLTLFLAIKIFMAFTVPALWYYFLLPVCSVIFVIYDIALTRVITAYLKRWRQRFRFLHK